MPDTQTAPRAPDDLVIDSVPGLVAILAPSGDVWDVNDQLVEYCGGPLEAIRLWGTNGIVHAEDIPRIAPIFASAIAAGVPYDFDARIRRFDGVCRWFRVCGRPLRDPRGTIARWYVLLTDIDDPKRAEALLSGENRLLEKVARGESMPAILEGICRLVESCASGCRCSVVLVDSTGTRLAHGASPSLPANYAASVVGRPVAPAEGPCAMAASLNQQVIVPDLTTEHRWAETEWWPIAMEHGLRACWSMPIPSSTGRILGAFAIYHDVSSTPTASEQGLIERVTNIASIVIERTQESEALRRSESLFAKVQEISATGGFFGWPASGEVYWSEQVYRIFEFDPGTPLTRELHQSRIHPDDLASYREATVRALREQCDFEYEVRLLMPDGSVKYLHSLQHATRDAEGKLLYVGAVQDVTARRLSELALSRARSELAHVSRVTTLGALTASIAHEVNQPLSGIITNASTCLRMLDADPPNVDGARETARRTLRDGNRAAEVLIGLRALYGGRDLTVEPLDLNDSAREVLALSRGDLQTNQVLLHTDLTENLPRVMGDRVQLQQVVLNLLRNASDAMSTVKDRPRTLLVATGQDEDSWVRFSVRDAGVGFEPAVTERLFDPFYTTKRDGMGMGLSVSRSIIERHHGRIWASPNDDYGATFGFAIPPR